MTLSLTAQTPDAPKPLSTSLSGSTGRVTLPIPPAYFPNGDYQLTANCTTADSVGHPVLRRAAELSTEPGPRRPDADAHGHALASTMS